jgi:uncharacterized spore protein YtfJ
MASHKTATSSNEVTASVQQALRDAEAAGASGFVQAIDRLAEQIGAHGDVRAVFGAPVTQQGVTVIPVARVIGGFGAGSGHGPPQAPAGSGGIGGGGGFVAMPVGFIEIDRTGARFRHVASSPELLGDTTALALRWARRGLEGILSALRGRATASRRHAEASDPKP